ncbi:MAG TPA: hypothetical protein VF546_22450 [Pyrinomonadaceae bacterium]|jgi:hypothetical protein
MAEEEPVVVTGGSVTVDVSDTLTGESPVPGWRRFGNTNARLLRIEVNGEPIFDLKPEDEVRVIYEI